MELTEIKNGFFGYNKTDVCRYITEMNEIHSADIKAVSDELAASKKDFEGRISALEAEKNNAVELNEALKAEADSLKAQLDEANELNRQLRESYEALEQESRDLREKSDIISTAIINAEKCAGSVINDANIKAKNMIDSAEERVNTEAERLKAARTYIAEVRESIEITLKKINAELRDTENRIDTKNFGMSPSADENDGERKSYSKEKFGLFKRA